MEKDLSSEELATEVKKKSGETYQTISTGRTTAEGTRFLPPPKEDGIGTKKKKKRRKFKKGEPHLQRQKDNLFSKFPKRRAKGKKNNPRGLGNSHSLKQSGKRRKKTAPPNHVVTTPVLGCRGAF